VSRPSVQSCQIGGCESSSPLPHLTLIRGVSSSSHAWAALTWTTLREYSQLL
jgi:hypothetical protein